MSLDQRDTIDIISTTPDGKVKLTISDHLSWDESLHLLLLQDKINAYLQFIESGQILKDYPNAVGRELIIEATMKYEPNEDGRSFLEKAKKTITKAGFGFQWRVLKLEE